MLLVAYEEVALIFLLIYDRLVRYHVYMCKVSIQKTPQSTTIHPHGNTGPSIIHTAVTLDIQSSW